MSLSDSRRAVGRVGELLKSQLAARTSVGSVDVGRPEAAKNTAGPKFNLFLYQVDLDSHLRNEPLDEGQSVPLWLVLRYLLTAYDDGKESDSTLAHELLGEGMLALQELNYLQPPATEVALVDNPEPLKLSFDTGDSELLSKLMQGTDEKYRLSVPFQVRPVMVFSMEPPGYAPLVTSIGADDNGPTVLPTLGPVLTSVEPEVFAAGDAFEVLGQDLTGEMDEICLGNTCFGITAAPAGRLRTTLPLAPGLSAGSHTITAVRTLPGGRRMHSNAVLGHLLPTVTDASPVTPLTPEGGGELSGDLTITGRLLGGPDDEIFVAFYGADGVATMVEGTGTTAQTNLTVSVSAEQALPAGPYRILLRVNGEQAVNSPEVDWS
ncbi:DUF4255 domain-containing protein [Halomonas cerina]|uniref:Pvc16 N-terminal domain-containing protein n=1 Tax=Halomonas cerina TaxID=447424 RepID=A0A839VCY0_9GAMM|nr:DUF4255 domain-containing protein [Halomonas cerina]MBB3191875.1 hypothetical protein [Halomonas cerina]